MLQEFTVFLDEGWSSTARLLPVTAAVALLLFFLKEFLEAIRKSKSNARRRRALRKVLAIETDYNASALWCLERCLRVIDNCFGAQGRELYFSETGTGTALLHSKNGDFEEVIPLYNFRMDKLSGSLLDLAEVDKKTFELALEMYSSVERAQRQRNHTYEYIVDESNAEAVPYLVGYALDDTNAYKESAGRFYRHLTGTELKFRPLGQD